MYTVNRKLEKKDRDSYNKSSLIKQKTNSKSIILNSNNELIQDNIMSFSSPPAIREWNNSIYVYNNNYVKDIPVINKRLTKLIKSFLNVFLKKRFLKRKRVLLRLKRLTSEQIFASKAEVKHTNDKVIIITYIYDESKRRSIHILRKLSRANQNFTVKLNTNNYILTDTGIKRIVYYMNIFSYFNKYLKEALFLDLQYYLKAKKLEFDLDVFKKEILKSGIIDILRDEVNNITNELNQIGKISDSHNKKDSVELDYNLELDSQIGLSFITHNLFNNNAIIYRLKEKLGEEWLIRLINSIMYFKNEFDDLAPWLKDKQFCMKFMFNKDIISTLNLFIYKMYMKKIHLKRSQKAFFSFIIKLYRENERNFLFSLNSLNNITKLESRLYKGENKSTYFKEPIFKILTSLVKRLYNKQVEFKFINLMHPYLNSDILLQIIALKLKNRKNRLLSVFKYSLYKVRIPIVNRVIEKYGKRSKTKKPQNIQSPNINKDIINQLLFDYFDIIKDKSYKLEYLVINSLKYKFIGGVRLEGKGRLTKRFTASRSIFKVRWKGGLKNIESSYKGLSSVILKGHLTSNVQYSTIKSKTRNGAFGIKGWISGK